MTKINQEVGLSDPRAAPESRTMPALTPDARENELIALALDEVEDQIRNHKASSQVLTHFLKLASARERIEKEILDRQKDLITAKTEAINSNRRSEELYSNALDAMRRYSGQSSASEDDDEFML